MSEHVFKKKFGQNFISDRNLLQAIVSDSGVSAGDNVLEIGAGAGALTEVLDKVAGKVVSFEIDKDLQPQLLGLGLKRTQFVFGDVMKVPTQDIDRMFSGQYHIVANLPYYITTPLLFKFLGQSSNVATITVMVQKEVAQRMVAQKGEQDYGLLSVMVAFYGSACITRIVGRKMFFPQPKVDSALVKIIVDRNKFSGIDKVDFYRFVQGCFSMRRKTLKNNLSHALGINVKTLSEMLDEKTLASRAEEFSLDELIEIYKRIKNNC